MRPAGAVFKQQRALIRVLGYRVKLLLDAFPVVREVAVELVDVSFALDDTRP